MRNTRSIFPLVGLAASLCAAPGARAQWAVVDVQAIVQLMQQVQTMQQALATARAQLAQEEQALQSMTGDRGMERLLSGTVRNYLPTDWGALQNLETGTSGSYAALAGEVRTLIGANAVLTAANIAALAPGDRQWLAASRRQVATRQALFRAALANASNRFAAIQSLIDAIPAATDQKGILDLQARIGAEQGMLQDEQSKLIVLSQAMQADGAALSERLRESVVAAHGRFESRFRPVP